jgi:predicted rRNA methylase YqxC with S4 and FtsJ domains
MRQTKIAVRRDRLLVERGVFAACPRNADAVRGGAVTVEGATLTKPGAAVAFLQGRAKVR